MCCWWWHLFFSCFSPLSAEEEETSSKTAGHMTGRPHSRQWNTDLLCIWHDGAAWPVDSMFMFPSPQICVAMKQTTLLLFSSTRSRSLSRWGCYFRWCQWHFIVLQHNEAGDNHTALHSAILWCHVFVQDDELVIVLRGHSSVLAHKPRSYLNSGIFLWNYRAEKENTFSWWKTPWTLLVLKVGLWLPDGPL